MLKILLFFSLAMSATACDALYFWEDDEQVEPEDKEATGKPATPPQKAADVAEDEDAPKSSNAKTMAQLAMRVDQLEAEVKRQREDFHVLRKGLMTGLIPSDWRDDLPRYSRQFSSTEGEGMVQPNYKDNAMKVILGGGEGAGGKGFSGLSEKERRQYEKRLAQANQYFRAADYGKAIAAYERIGEDYSDRITKGNHLLWIGAGWYRLRDYQLSRKALSKLIRMYKASPWVPEAEFLLAKVDFNEGFVERAVERLNSVISNFGNQNVAQRAKEELKRIEEHL